MRDDAVLLISMLEHARLIHAKMSVTSRQEFDADVFLQLAIAKALENIGEAARGLSPTARERYPQIPWPKVVGMRNTLVHEYFRTDLNAAWDTSTNAIRVMLATLQPEFGPIVDARPPEEPEA
jgi:uncharacterized protein with HEPN domain